MDAEHYKRRVKRAMERGYYDRLHKEKQEKEEQSRCKLKLTKMEKMMFVLCPNCGRRTKYHD